ncbi:MAG TPA: DUF3108 domain-containing protein [Alphaproteobacteria bacterium]|nr:DUF3108 domain-containing protein [Alphaproteobacteria bacterium]
MNKFLAILFFMIISVPLAQAAEESKNLQKMKYDVYAGGIHALQAHLKTDMSAPDRYDVALTAKTYGMLGKLAPWEGIFTTKGWKGEKINHPELHQAITTWKDEKETKSYRYKKDGSFVSYSVQEGSKKEEEKKPEEALTKETSDLLTATLNTMQLISAENKCEGETDIFDGKRRFKLVFKEQKKVELQSSRYNVYTGPAIECTVEVQPVAGKWREKPRGWMSIQEQGRERGTMPTVWFAKVQEGQVAVPVKVRVKTDYGTLFMHLTDYQSAGKKMTLKD